MLKWGEEDKKEVLAKAATSGGELELMKKLRRTLERPVLEIKNHHITTTKLSAADEHEVSIGIMYEEKGGKVLVKGRNSQKSSLL